MKVTVLASNVTASISIDTRIQIQTTADKSNLLGKSKKSWSFESSNYRKLEESNWKEGKKQMMGREFN